MAITPEEVEQRHKELLLEELRRAEGAIDKALIESSSDAGAIAVFRLYHWHSVDHNKLMDLIIKEYLSKQWYIEVEISDDGPVIKISKEKQLSIAATPAKKWWQFWRT